MSSDSDPRSIVGVGASAGGLEAFTQLLSGLPVDTGLAFVLVQHLDPRHDSILPELLSSRTRMPVVQVTEGTSVKRNHVYVIPPNTTMAISGRVLHLSPRRVSDGRHMPIDVFFSSLAEDQKGNSIGVILSGAASDGTLGLGAIKAEGGVTFAQDDTAVFDSMPRSAVVAGAVDFVLPPEQIAAELAAIARHPYQSTDRPPNPETEIVEGAALTKLLALVRISKGIDFSQYKSNTVQRRIIRRIVLAKVPDLEHYLELLRQAPTEVDALFNDLLINVTEFFRDPAVFAAVKETAFPAILKDRTAGSPIRVWVPGCSTGEEVYSIAITLVECLEGRGSDESIQIFGTDVSEAAIERARGGAYAEAVAASVSPDRLRRFFTKIEHGYQISRTIREMCIFSVQNITKDPPLSRMDLISCRNLLIYFGANLQKRAMGVFVYALQPNGCLILGHSETPGALSDYFVTVDREHRIYSRKLNVAQPVFDLPTRLASFPPFSAAPESAGVEPPKAQELPGGTTVQRYVDRMLLGQYAPAGLLVDKNSKIIEFRGAVGPYLGPAAGEADLHLLKMIREELALHVGAALTEVRTKNRGIRLEDVLMRDFGQFRRVTIAVTPLTIPSVDQHYLVLFEEQRREDGAAPGRDSGETITPVADQDARDKIAHLEEELTATRRYLQTIIEELGSSNEEAQSSNEELQSANEELQTTKEELQSSNEELTTLNGEMQSRNAELSQVNNDLLNLLSSMNVPIVMMDSNLRIRRFTPVSERVLNLIGTDVGRPISDLKPRINTPDLEEILHRVIDTLAPHEQEVRDQDGRWYSMRVRPYRTAENRIEGAVLQLLDVDEIKRSLEQARNARDFAEAIIDTVREPLAVLDQDLRIETVNRSFYQMFHLSAEQVAGHVLFEVGGGLWDFPKVHQLLENIISGGPRFEDLEIEHNFRGIGWKTMMLSACKIEQGDRTGKILLAFEDVTERKKAAEARYRRLFEAAKDAIIIVDAHSGDITELNPYGEQLFGYSRAEVVGRKMWEAGPLKDLADARALLARVTAEGVVRLPDLSLSARDDSVVQVEAIANAYDEGDQKMIQFNVRDIGERKRFERQLEHTQKMESLGLLAGGVAHDFNNLLAGIMVNTSLVLAETEKDSPSLSSLREVMRASERAANLTRQMLDYAGKGRFVTEHNDLNELITDISALVRSSLPKMLTFDLVLTSDPTYVEGDSGQIQQLMMNLMINAGEAIPAGRPGAVTVRTQVRELSAVQLQGYVDGEHLGSGKYIVLEVIDTGSGMDEATQSRIFDPFFTTKFTGRGLGLAAALGIIRRHHGAIRIDSELGRGTSFQVVLPASGRGPVKQPDGTAPPTLVADRTVLLVDDEDTVRNGAKAGLERNGYRVIVAENGADGVRIFRDRHGEISAVVLDRTMPGMGGEEALAEMQAIEPKVPIILSTGYDEAETLSRLAGRNLAGFLQKPYTIETLLGEIQSALNRNVACNSG
jgi:two-component system, chemotaxis family, CheB/CheR fusion protein